MTQSTVKYSIEIDSEPVLDPGEARLWAVENGTPLDFWGRANSYTNVLGREPGTAWLLVTRKTADKIFIPGSPAHTLTFTYTASSEYVKIDNMTAVRQTTMNLVSGTDPDSAMLIELHDVKHFLAMSSCDVGYNCRIPGHDGDDPSSFYSDTLNAGALWTWEYMMADLWSRLPSVAGSYPALPIAPDSHPENIRTLGRSAWDVFNDVLAKLSCAIRYVPETQAATTTFEVIRLYEDGDVGAIRLTYKERLGYDWAPKDEDAPIFAEKVVVYFYRSPKCGWQEAYQVEVASGIADAIVGTKIAFWDDLVATMLDGVATNAAALATRAASVVAKYVLAVDRALKRKGWTYWGVASAFKLQSQIQEIRYRDFGDDDAICTDVMRRPVLDKFMPTRYDACNRRLKARLCGDLETTAETINVYLDSVVDQDTGEHVCLDQLPSNFMGMSGQDWNWILLRWDITLGTSGNYYGEEGQHKDQCFVRDVRVDTNEKCLQQAMLKIGVMYSLSSIPLTACTIVNIGPCTPVSSGALECDPAIEYQEDICCGDWPGAEPCNSSGAC